MATTPWRTRLGPWTITGHLAEGHYKALLRYTATIDGHDTGGLIERINGAWWVWVDTDDDPMWTRSLNGAAAFILHTHLDQPHAP